MEVVASSPNNGAVPPFQHRDVREWSRLDSITGVLERARLETDHWAASASGQKHQYGKVVDSRARTGVEGSLQQRRQLEVFQSQVPGGRLQVVRTHTVASSRSWSSSSSATANANAAAAAPSPSIISSDFENLKLAVNPLDLSSQKSKASVGRSGGRRPPTRPRLREEAAKSIHRVSRLCHQLHEEAVQKILNKGPLAISEKRESGDGSPAITFENETNSNYSIESDEVQKINGHTNLGRTKSNSSEDLSKSLENATIEDIDDFEQLENWRRTSKIRRSLQFPKSVKSITSSRPPDLPINTGSVRKIKEDLETGRRLNTALRGNNVDLEALDQILQSISSSSSIYSDVPSSNETPERDTNHSLCGVKKQQQKKNAFITVESLQAVRGRLKPLSSPVQDIISTFENKSSKEEETDDGIGSEEVSNGNGTAKPEKMTSEMPTTRVRSYVYGMEAMLNRKPVSGTGSLESRSSNKSSGSGGSRSEDWYNRRKSYGFEQVHNQQEQNNSIALKSKSKVESSTDSGICRSTEIVVLPADVKNDSDLDTEQNEKYRYGKISSIQINKPEKDTNTGGGFLSQKTVTDTNLSNVWNRVISHNGASHTLDANWKQRDSDSGTITIPIISESTTNLFENNKKFFETNKEYDNKRHSIAVDESKYVPRSSENKALLFPQSRTSLVLNDSTKYDNEDDDASTFNKRQKKVEFCKTEVHFAAESGRVNIVETDEKPPPTNNFRRRRRNSGIVSNQISPEDSANRNGLPILHFGDSTYEKTLFGVSDPSDSSDTVPTSDTPEPESSFDTKNNYSENSTVTVNSTSFAHSIEDDYRELSESEIQIRGILKNKPIKPKPYHLGDNDEHLNEINSTDDQENRWGVRLKPVPKQENQMWRSTVTLRSNTFDSIKSIDSASTSDVKQSDTESDSNEIQQLLKSLKPARKTMAPMQTNLITTTAAAAAAAAATTTTGNTTTSSNGIDVKIGGSVTPATSPPTATTTENKLASSWTVADRVKQVENRRWTENKGYSTKVNFGSGEATVVENNAQELNVKPERYTTWPRKEETHSNDRKQTSILNKGLVVRIGHDTMCSKTTTNHDNTTTTTKITIDLSPSPTNDTQPVFKSIKLPRATLHSLKSTSLIMNTFSKTENDTAKMYQVRDEQQQQHLQNGFKPWKSSDLIKESAADQLAALRRLYDDADQSDSEKADEEVRSYMSGLIEENDLNEFEDETSSVVSGSWSKMRAYKNMKQHIQSQSKPLSFTSDKISDNHLEKGSYFVNLRISTSSSNKNSQVVTETFNKKVCMPSKTYNKCDLKSVLVNDKLSSPSLVGQNITKSTPKDNNKLSPSDLSKYFVPSNKTSPSATSKSPSQNRSPLSADNTISQQQVGRASSFSTVSTAATSSYKPIARNHEHVLRNPSQSQLAYFGVAINGTKYAKKQQQSPTVQTEQSSRVSQAKTVVKSSFVSAPKLHITSPSPKKQSPVYENVNNIKKNDRNKVAVDYRRKEYDSSIMDDLNNAANEILKAVDAFAHEESPLSEDEQTQPERLETISETKSWKNSTKLHETRESFKKENTPTKIKPSSSTSSIDSITREYQKSTKSSILKQKNVDVVQVQQSCSITERQKKKISSADPALAKATRARRLQRASSREALLQSHGSSSEDLSKNVEAPARRPRLSKRVKSQTNGVVETTSSKKSTMTQTSPVKKHDIDTHILSERLPAGTALPEIRHKTAISTIKSTAEKQALREAKAEKLKLEEQKRKKAATPRKTINNNKIITPPSAQVTRISRTTKASPTNGKDGSRNIGANIKKSGRIEGSSRH